MKPVAVTIRPRFGAVFKTEIRLSRGDREHQAYRIATELGQAFGILYAVKSVESLVITEGQTDHTAELTSGLANQGPLRVEWSVPEEWV